MSFFRLAASKMTKISFHLNFSFVQWLSSWKRTLSMVLLALKLNRTRSTKISYSLKNKFYERLNKTNKIIMEKSTMKVRETPTTTNTMLMVIIITNEKLDYFLRETHTNYQNKNLIIIS